MPSRRHRRPLVAATAAAAAAVVLVAAPAAIAQTRQQTARSAAMYAKDAGYHIGIAVLDTWTGQLTTSGDYSGIFASESLVKVFIATRLLLTGQMHGATESTAWKMITQSDDWSASALYGRVGGDGLEPWIERHYHVPDLGYGPSRAGWWGNTHLTPVGLAKLYGKLKADPKVAPWLLRAMHHATEYGSDGTYQFFGLPSATSHPAIKQGWGNDTDYCCTADFNTTGFVNGNRYAVVMLARGPSYTYGTAISGMLTAAARRLLPGGTFPDPIPTVTGLSLTRVGTGGGATLTVFGRALQEASQVRFGAVIGTHLVQVGPQKVQVTIPAHAAGVVNVRVVTSHGTSPAAPADQLRFLLPPTVTAVHPNTGPVVGGNTVTVYGGHFGDLKTIRFGTALAKVVKVGPKFGTVVVTAPPAKQAGAVPVVAVTPYGTSAPVTYTYTAPTSQVRHALGAARHRAGQGLPGR